MCVVSGGSGTSAADCVGGPSNGSAAPRGVSLLPRLPHRSTSAPLPTYACCLGLLERCQGLPYRKACSLRVRLDGSSNRGRRVGESPHHTTARSVNPAQHTGLKRHPLQVQLKPGKKCCERDGRQHEITIQPADGLWTSANVWTTPPGFVSRDERRRKRVIVRLTK